jgi:ABC-2 type transport system ATP-binding protein
LLEAHDLHKSYGALAAVSGVSLGLERGRIVGLLGPNGAGKTTTVAMLAGILAPDRGEVRIDGEVLRGDADPRKARIGLVPQDLALYDELTPLDNLRFFGALFGMKGAALEKAAADALAFVGLSDRAKDRVRTFSGGMKRRLNLAAGLLHGPDLVLLDEPTVGVDPQSRNAIFDNLEELRRRGKALLYTTHYMEEAERLCDRIVIVDHGKVIADDTLRGLLSLLPAAARLRVELQDGGDGAWVGALLTLPGVESATLEDGTLVAGLRETSAGAGVLGWLNDQSHGYAHFSTERGDLETVFLTLTGRRLRD